MRGQQGIAQVQRATSTRAADVRQACVGPVLLSMRQSRRVEGRLGGAEGSTWTPNNTQVAGFEPNTSFPTLDCVMLINEFHQWSPPRRL